MIESALEDDESGRECSRKIAPLLNSPLVGHWSHISCLSNTCAVLSS